MVREINKTELNELLELYLYLHEDSIPEMTESLKEIWNIIMNDMNHHIIVFEIDDKIVSSCVCVIIPNLTRGVRPYAFIENVVTHSEYRGHGYATKCLEYARRNEAFKVHKKCLEGYHKQKLPSKYFYDVVSYIKYHDDGMLQKLGNKRSRIEILFDKISEQETENMA